MKTKINEIYDTANKVILDKKNEVRLALICILAGGHLLVEDLPGVGKTTLVQVLAKLLGFEFSRIQFTSDLLPADIIGNSIFNEEDQRFHFHKGPLFAQLILADELNRANPRTQSSLLQAMEEGEVAVDGKNIQLPKPFFIIATQNPAQQVGTFPIPESQLDRFLMSLELNFVSHESEISLIQGFNPRKEIENLKPIFTTSEFVEVLKQVENIEISNTLARYISDLLVESRKNLMDYSPLSTRTGIAIGKAAKACAYFEGRKFATPDDVQDVALSVLGHRLAGIQGVKKGKVLAEKLISKVPVPN